MKVTICKGHKNISCNKISDYYYKNTESIIVATGFIVSTLDFFSTTLEGGGSDYTASITGATTKEDVDGLMSADPNKVKTAIAISNLNTANKKLSTLSIFTESEYENRLLNVIHNLFTNKEESVDI